jgi:hypothetical protein
MAFREDSVIAGSRVREVICWGSLLAGAALGGICYYFMFMYGALSVAPSPAQDHYRFLANVSFYLGIGGPLLGLIIFLSMRKKPSRTGCGTHDGSSHKSG